MPKRARGTDPPTMRAAVFRGVRKVGLEQVPIPEPAAGEVLVEIRAAGICGSDLHRYRGDDPWAPPAARPDLSEGSESRSEPVSAAGHEMAGEVARVGHGAEGVAVGDRVAVEPLQLAFCGRCPACRAERVQLCPSRGEIGGRRRRSRGFAEYDLAVPSHLHPVPDDLPLAVAALADVYGCALHALHRAGEALARRGGGGRVAILGTGSVALALGQMARRRGHRVLVVGRRRGALDVARRARAADDVAGGSAADDAAARDADLADAFDVVFEVVGGRSSDTLRRAVELVRPGGRVVILGAFVGDVEIPYRAANRKEIDVVWSNGYGLHRGRREFALALDWIGRHRGEAAALVTHRFPFERVADAFRAACDKAESGAVKVVLEPHG